MNISDIKKYFSYWLALIRLPNLFTVPCDPLIGFLLAGGKLPDLRLFMIFASSLSYYIFGLITNDIRDYKEDLKTNPQRPLPAGNIGIHAAKFAALLLLCSAIFFSFSVSTDCGITGIFLLMAIILYNFFLKQNPVFGPLLLAACRVLNVIIGSAITGLTIEQSSNILTLLHLILLYFVYIFGISVAARDENQSGLINFFAGFFCIFSSLFFLTLYFLGKALYIYNYTALIAPSFISGFLASTIIWILFFYALIRRIVLRKSQISSDIGRIITAIILFHAVFLSSSAFTREAILLVLIYPAALASSRFFKGS